MRVLAALLVAFGLEGCARQADVASPTRPEPQSVPLNLDVSSIDVSFHYVSEPTASGRACHYEMEIYLGGGSEDEQRITMFASGSGNISRLVVGERTLPSYSDSKGDDLDAWNFALYVFRPLFSSNRQASGIAEMLVGPCTEE